MKEYAHRGSESKGIFGYAKSNRRDLFFVKPSLFASASISIFIYEFYLGRGETKDKPC